MKIAFATKRSKNGNRNILIMDTSRKEYAINPSHWFTREDFIECNLADIRKLKKHVIENNYKELDCMNAELS